jgi:hypothetical protein
MNLLLHKEKNMNNLENQKNIAKEVLSKLEVIDPTCILAGGAPRDWYFEKLASDLDFYVYFRPDFAYQKWRYAKQLEKIGLNNFYIKGKAEFPENYKRNPYLITALEGKYKEEKIHIMFMSEKTFSCVVNYFPFGICQVWWKGEEIKTTENFKESVNHKILRLLNNLYSDADGYIQKIKDKFPDYLFIGKQ